MTLFLPETILRLTTCNYLKLSFNAKVAFFSSSFLETIRSGKLTAFNYIGIILIAGFIGILLCDKFKVPQVIGYLLAGFILGKSCLGFISPIVNQHLEIATLFALGVIGFSIGGELVFDRIKSLGPSILIITVMESFGAFICVGAGTYLVTHDTPLALLLGALASATAPAATAGVLWQYNSKGPLTTTLLAVVGLDDASSLVIYAFSSAIALNLLKHSGPTSILHLFVKPAIEIFSAVLIGAILGFILHLIMQKVIKDEYVLIIVIGALILGSGIAQDLGLSLILINMTMGFVLVNMAERNKQAISVVHRFTPPFYLMFLILVGARLDISLIPSMGVLGIVYLLARFGGKFIGAYLGSTISKAPENVRKYLGFGLLSAAGVNIGLVIEVSGKVAAINTPATIKMSHLIIAVVIATIFLFDSIGPMFVKRAIFKTGEAHPEAEDSNLKEKDNK